MVASKVKTRPEVVVDLSRTTEFNRAILDSITAQVAVIDQCGTILFTNHAWVEFRSAVARNNGRPLRGQVGENYLDICEAIGSEGCERTEAAEGVAQCVAGCEARFQLQYEVDEESWLKVAGSC